MLRSGAEILNSDSQNWICAKLSPSESRNYGQDTIGGYLNLQSCSHETRLPNRNESPVRTTSTVRWPACELVEVRVVVLADPVGAFPKS
jgi:hypothetical protein